MSLLAAWPEIDSVLKQGRFELVLKNIDSNKRKPSINDDELQSSSFPQGCVLNLLYIGKCGLSRLSGSIANCMGLTQLILKDNLLSELPAEIGELKQLKLIDVSSNSLTRLPSTLSQLVNLQSLDINKNKIGNDGLFDFSDLAMLHILEASHNELESFPPSLTSPSLVKLHTLNFSHNRISDVPAEVCNLEHLKDLKLESNSVSSLPLGLAFLEKLRFLDLRGNPFEDRRFRKLANDSRAKVSSQLDYLRRKSAEMESDNTKKSGAASAANGDENYDSASRIQVRIGVPQMTVKRFNTAKSARPFILTCMVHNIDLTGTNFTKIIKVQTRLHQTECGQRTLATIGTHDLACLRPPLSYMALPPDELFITALHKKTPVSGRDLLANLLLDSELARKREKRSQVSPVHRYVHLVKDLPLLPCLVDSEGLVISLPPLTNSDLTKLNESCRDVLVEVSSAESLDHCQRVFDLLLTEFIEICPAIQVDQMRVYTEKGDLLGEYPSRSSLPQLNPSFVEYSPDAQ